MLEMASSGAGNVPAATGEVYQGVVKSASQKFGFIESADLQVAYGCDCFCLAHQLMGYNVGDQVQFAVGLNKDGKPQAIEIEPLGGGPPPQAAAKGYGKTGGGKGPGGWKGGAGAAAAGGGGGSFGGGAGGGPGMPMPNPTGETYLGVIKSISAKFGFIECAEIKANYGCDCFCLGRQLAGCNVGEQVQFEVGINEEGKPQAISISGSGWTSVWNDGKGGGSGGGGGGGGAICGKGGGCKGGKCGGGKPMGKQAGKAMGKGCWGGGWDGGWGGGWGGGWDGGWGGGYWSEPAWGPPKGFCSGGKGKGKAGGKPTFSSPNGVKRKPEDTGEVFTGTVKSTSAKFGFIQSEEVMQKYGQDCFCLGEQLMSFSVGDAVQFTVGINQKGQPQALEVSAMDGGGGPAAKAMRMF